MKSPSVVRDANRKKTMFLAESVHTDLKDLSNVKGMSMTKLLEELIHKEAEKNKDVLDVLRRVRGVKTDSVSANE